jgi:hypothetical protein
MQLVSPIVSLVVDQNCISSVTAIALEMLVLLADKN